MKSVTSDAIGNTVGYDGWTYNWRGGKELSGMTRTGTNISYKYDAKGLRVQKTMNGTATDYLLNGEFLAGLKKGTDTMHFFFDKDKKPQVVDFNGTKYYYAHNLVNSQSNVHSVKGVEISFGNGWK